MGSEWPWQARWSIESGCMQDKLKAGSLIQFHSITVELPRYVWEVVFHPWARGFGLHKAGSLFISPSDMPDMSSLYGRSGNLSSLYQFYYTSCMLHVHFRQHRSSPRLDDNVLIPSSNPTKTAMPHLAFDEVKGDLFWPLVPLSLKVELTLHHLCLSLRATCSYCCISCQVESSGCA